MENETSMIHLRLCDKEWPFTYTTHERQIVRAIVVDGEGDFYFVRIVRNDDFGNGAFIETSGGGVEAGEELCAAIHRELREELGATVEILCKLGVVEDSYNLIHRRNINHYYLCRALSFGERQLTEDEIGHFHLSILKLSYEDAVREYNACTDKKLGRLLANRELPILHHAKAVLDQYKKQVSP